MDMKRRHFFAGLAGSIAGLFGISRAKADGPDLGALKLVEPVQYQYRVAWLRPDGSPAQFEPSYFPTLERVRLNLEWLRTTQPYKTMISRGFSPGIERRPVGEWEVMQLPNSPEERRGGRSKYEAIAESMRDFYNSPPAG